MKSLRQRGKSSKLSMNLFRSLVWAGIISIAVYFILYYSGGEAITYYFNHSDFAQKQEDKQLEDLQQYIDRERISSHNLDMLAQWEKKQPMIVLEMYLDGKCIYSSEEEATDAVFVGFVEKIGEGNNDIKTIHLQDTAVYVYLYSDFFYQYYTIWTVASFVIAVIIFVFLFLRSVRRLIKYVCQLTEDMRIIEGGDLDHEVRVQGADELAELADSMNSMRHSFKLQIQQEQVLYQKNRDMITEMSHDLRTPLTSLMLFTDIVRFHKYSSQEELQTCLEKIDEKARQFKKQTDRILENTLSEDGTRQEDKKQATALSLPQILRCEEAFGRWTADITEELQDAGYMTVLDAQWPASSVSIRGDYLERIGNNIISNIYKYADKEKDIIIKAKTEDGELRISFSNGCSKNIQVSDSHGIGLTSISETMVNMNGLCQTSRSGERFDLTLVFPVSFSYDRGDVSCS